MWSQDFTSSFTTTWITENLTLCFFSEPVAVNFDAVGNRDNPNATVQLLPSGQPTAPQATYPPPAGYPPPAAAQPGAYPTVTGTAPSYPPATGNTPSYPPAYPPQNAPYPPTSGAHGYPPAPGNAPTYPPTQNTPYPPAQGQYPPTTSYPPSTDSREPSAPSAPPAEAPVYVPPEYHGFDSSSVPPPPSYDEVTGGKQT